MNRKDQEAEYRKLMGHEAADRQTRAAAGCSHCGAKPGSMHFLTCKYRGSKVADPHAADARKQRS